MYTIILTYVIRKEKDWVQVFGFGIYNTCITMPIRTTNMYRETSFSAVDIHLDGVKLLYIVSVAEMGGPVLQN